MADLFARHSQALDRLKERGRYRQLLPRAGHDFASNDYLGLADSDVLRAAAADAIARGVPVGAGGARLLRGNAHEHACLEEDAAAFFGTEAALFMGGGFNANLAIFSSLPQQGDLVLYDALIHASTHDGMRLGRAEARAFAHSDVQAAANAIRDWRAEGGSGRVWIAVEAVYSMDGDKAPIADLFQLAQENDAILVVDEAHSTGVMGAGGRGLAHAVAHHPNVLSLHTCGKALGVSGALICGARVLVETLINKARAFIYATAPSPLNAALVRAALREVAENRDLRRRADATLDHAHREAARLCGLSGFKSQILPVVIGADKPTMALAAALQEIGYDIRGIRPPTVPRNTARLRISITLNTSAEVISSMFSDLAQLREVHP
ncbi:aminotransferase class I/II-fold pyridoxal phosphate-dependent enzyme [Epibacterium sp. SM1979]|uniref:Aminotransferase class I/II-fold pyridoxal phosphate-dependent enzyme n=1 Tax=Tritonibacter litoralis TaxID=2662264 RepID=A0A843YF44_9RHOB|nr:8-amino-7-oxononanoate synthase [Tritonibacter litoralis]MQQ09521.1 aminotransferase class I/II-fold pyridoxal phosphate-dependent enzyme [Tritonibacter litoralis]